MGSARNSIEPVLVTPLRSPAAKKQARLRAQLTWRRAAVRLLIGGVVAACLVRVGAIAVEPLVATYRSGRDIQSLEVQLHNERTRQHRLQREIQFLSTKAGIEEEARRLGWVKQGETSLQIVAPAGGAHAPAPATPGVRKTGSERLRQWLDTWLAALQRKRAARR